MKIIVVGSTGTLGSAVTADLEKDHEVVKVGFSEGDFQVDIADIASIRAMILTAIKPTPVVAATASSSVNRIEAAMLANTRPPSTNTSAW